MFYFSHPPLPSDPTSVLLSKLLHNIICLEQFVAGLWHFACDVLTFTSDWHSPIHPYINPPTPPISTLHILLLLCPEPPDPFSHYPISIVSLSYDLGGYIYSPLRCFKHCPPFYFQHCAAFEILFSCCEFDCEFLIDVFLPYLESCSRLAVLYSYLSSYILVAYPLIHKN